MRRTLATLIAALCLAAGGGTASDDACRYCGRKCGEYPSWDRDRVMGLVAAHEAICSSRSSPGRVYADDVDIYQQAVQAQWAEAARRLREVAVVGESLAGQARALFDSLSPNDLASLQTALEAALDHTRQALARNQELETRLRTAGLEVTELRQRLAATQDRHWQLLRKLEETERTVADLRMELARVEPEAAEARAGVARLDRAASRQSERLTTARTAYWRTVGNFFRGRDLGSPRDYIPEIRPREAHTQRGTRGSIPEVQSQVRVQAVAVAAPAPPVAAVWSRAFLTPAAAPPQTTKGPATAEGLREQIKNWEGAVSRSAELSQKSERLLIESRTAAGRLREILDAAARRERQAGILGNEREALRNRLQWAVWELDVSTRAARERIGQIFREWRKEQAWDLSRQLWQAALRNEGLGRSAYSQLRLAYDLVDGDMPKVAPAIRDSDRPEVRDLVNRLQNLDQERGKEFLQNLFDIEDRPLPGQKWIEKLLGHEPGDGK
jgi:hypothetical protein